MKRGTAWVVALVALAGCGNEGGGVVREDTQPKADSTSLRGEAKSEPSVEGRQDGSQGKDAEPVKNEPVGRREPPAGPDEAPDLASGRDVARAKNKKLVVIVHAPWDQQSRLLLDEGLKNPEVRQLLKDTVIVKMDFDAPETQQTVRERKIDTLPRVIFYTPDGKLYDHIKGYNDPEWLIKRLKMPPQQE
ncbi:MAG: thioredoxin family protein [Fimbriimonadaceae bacterium]|nr:thioredoxin family protein [Fimbriimonadaceae bacterium]QYK57557.1 MAG: thioredoxin family protein [Fimbriimonadaceae bacterium]